MDLTDEDIDYLEMRARGRIDGTGPPWAGIGPEELLSLVQEIKRLRCEKPSADDIRLIRAALKVFGEGCLLMYREAETPAEREGLMVAREEADALRDRLGG